MFEGRLEDVSDAGDVTVMKTMISFLTELLRGGAIYEPGLIVLSLIIMNVN